MTKRRNGDEDDGTTSQRDRLPRTALAPDRPTIPQLGRAKRGVGKDDLIDDGPTMFDPSVPTGAAESPPLMAEDDEPTGAKAKVPGATMVGKRPLKQTVKETPPRGTPRIQPVPPIDSRELPTQRHQLPVKFDPHARIDDSSRTNKWQAEELAEEPPHRDSGPPTNPLPDRSGAGYAAVPRSGPQLPLAPGPRSAQIRVVSMKTPQEIEAEEKAERVLPQVRIRSMSEQNPNATPPQGMGYFAPPRDPNQARSRRWQDFVIWGSLVVIVAAVVTLAVWFLAR